MPEAPLPRASFTRMDQGTQADWMAIAANSFAFARGLPDRVLAHLIQLGGDTGGFAVDRLEHSLQTATLAHRAGRDEEYVVCALLHDIGDLLGPFNHADIGASLLKPFVSEQNHWMLEQHGIFQGYYFFQSIGQDRDMRERFRGHPHFEHTAEFCERFDQVAFDPNFASLPLTAFEPMIRRVMSQPKRSIYLAE
jgi:predicted HD phosphohydrolase